MTRYVAGMLVLLLAAGSAGAGADRPARVALPEITIEKGGKCVAPADEMRRDHMKMLMQQRDQTVHKGIRGAQHSLKGCIDCHAGARTNSVLGKGGFCESCHAYAAVSIDCFECHSPARQRRAGGARP